MFFIIPLYTTTSLQWTLWGHSLDQDEMNVDDGPGVCIYSLDCIIEVLLYAMSTLDYKYDGGLRT